MEREEFQQHVGAYYSRADRQSALTFEVADFLDVTLLRDYLHDATFSFCDMTYDERQKKVTIALDRDCWEVSSLHDGVLYFAKSELMISNVTGLRIMAKDGLRWLAGMKKREGPDIRIAEVEANKVQTHRVWLTFRDFANDVRLVFELDAPFPHAILRDLEPPQWFDRQTEVPGGPQA